MIRGFGVFSCLLIWCTLAAHSQSVFVDVADQYLRDGNLDAAITEYYRHAYLYPDDENLSSVYAKLGSACREAGLLNPSLRAYSTAIEKSRTPAERVRVRLELALTHLVFDEPLQAQLVVLRVLASPPADSVLWLRAHAIAGVACLLSHQWNEASEYLREWARGRPDVDVQMQQLLTTLSDTTSIPHRDPTVVVIMSAIIPGLGQMYCGEYLDGLNSMVLNGAMIYNMYSQIEQSRWVALGLVGLPLVSRYYMGNLDHAERYANEFNDRARRAYAAQIVRRFAEMNR